ncbi:unnamed protein product [Closterium sp. NIES-53]
MSRPTNRDVKPSPQHSRRVGLNPTAGNAGGRGVAGAGVAIARGLSGGGRNGTNDTVPRGVSNSGAVLSGAGGTGGVGGGSSPSGNSRRLASVTTAAAAAAERALLADAVAATNPETRSPFASLGDACDR